jgi:hypothetical protein
MVITWKLLNSLKYIHLRTRYDKLYNEEMDIKYNSIKKHVKGRIERKPQNSQDFHQDIRLYLFNNQIREYNQNFEKALSKTMKFIESEENWDETSAHERIR